MLRYCAELFTLFDRLASILDLPPDEEANREHFEHAQHVLYRSMRMLEMLVMESGLPGEMVEHLIDRIHRRIRRK